MLLTIADRALESIISELGHPTDHPIKIRRKAFLDQAKRSIESGALTSDQISRVAERQAILRGMSAKSVHRQSPMLRAIYYGEAALTIVVAV